VRGWSFSWNVSNNMGMLLFQQRFHKTSNLRTVKYLQRESHKLFTTGTSKVKVKKAVELAELGFYKKNSGFEGAQDVLDFYNKNFNKISPVETQVILPHSSAEVVHSLDMEAFAVAEVIDPQEAE
jgi:hypothetical protein